MTLAESSAKDKEFLSKCIPALIADLSAKCSKHKRFDFFSNCEQLLCWLVNSPA